jgi:hypothetical protein
MHSYENRGQIRALAVSLGCHRLASTVWGFAARLGVGPGASGGDNMAPNRCNHVVTQRLQHAANGGCNGYSTAPAGEPAPVGGGP